MPDVNMFLVSEVVVIGLIAICIVAAILPLMFPQSPARGE